MTIPKTKKSERQIVVPSAIIKRLQVYIHENEESISITNRIFNFSAASINYTIKRGCDIKNLPRIRLHDLRHSHVSLLVDMGVNVNLIADRLGHEKIETTLGIYTHLYPKRRNEVSKKLENYIEPFKLHVVQ